MKISNIQFNKYDFQKQSQIITKSTYKDKGELILESDAPDKIINKLSPEENYFIVNNLNKSNWPEYIQYCNSEQLIFISDFECWEYDQINENNFLFWLESLHLTSEEKLYEWVRTSDFELIVGSFINFVEVIKTEDINLIDDYIGDRPFFTIDNLYYICIDCNNFDTIKRIITMFFEKDKKYYVALLESVIAAGKAEIVEAALKHRNARLNLSGFPDKEEAIKILAPITDWNEVAKKENQNNTIFYQDINSNTLINGDNSELFFNQAITMIEDEDALQDIELELTCITNKVIICENHDLKQPQTIIEAIDGVKSILSLSLENLSKSNPLAAKELLSLYWIEDIFRWGVSLVKKIKLQAEAIFHSSEFTSFSNFKHFLGSPFGESLQGIIGYLPKKLKSNANFEILEYEYFSSSKQTDLFTNELLEINDIIIFFKKHLNNNLENIYNNDFQTLNFQGSNINIISLLSTLTIHIANNGKISFEPITDNGLSLFINNYLNSPIKDRICNLKKQLKELIFTGRQLKESLILNFIINRLVEELSNLNPSHKIKTKYFNFLITLKND